MTKEEVFLLVLDEAIANMKALDEQHDQNKAQAKASEHVRETWRQLRIKEYREAETLD